MPKDDPRRVDVLVDTGVFLSAADEDEPRHLACARLLQEHRGRIGTTAPVLAEAAWMIEHRLGPAAEARFLTMAATATIFIADLTQADYRRCIELIDRYADLGLGLVDASVVAVAERLGVTTIATLNTRDFHVVRPAHADAFELIPVEAG